MAMDEVLYLNYIDISIKVIHSVSQITPLSHDKAVHLPIWAPWGKNGPKMYLV